MKDAVRECFYDFNLPMEGGVPYFYQDVKALVSVGVGILCDPIQLALNLPFVKPDGLMANRNEIAAEWLRIKNLPPDAKGRTAAQLGHLYAKPHAKLRLSAEGLRSTLLGKLHQNDVYLRGRFPDFEAWPADAQLAVHSLSWACGPAFRFPKCEAALRARDWLTAAVECFMPEERTISGLRPRNRVNALLFRNASMVDDLSLDPSTLYWPRDLWNESPAAEVPTQPERVVPWDIVHALPDTRPANDDDEPDDAA